MNTYRVNLHTEAGNSFQLVHLPGSFISQSISTAYPIQDLWNCLKGYVKESVNLVQKEKDLGIYFNGQICLEFGYILVKGLPWMSGLCGQNNTLELGGSNKYTEQKRLLWNSFVNKYRKLTSEFYV